MNQQKTNVTALFTVALAAARPNSLRWNAICVMNTAGMSDEVPGPPAVRAITRTAAELMLKRTRRLLCQTLGFILSL